MILSPVNRIYNQHQTLTQSNNIQTHHKCQANINKQDRLIHTQQRKQQINFTLQHLLAQHRNAYMYIQQWYEHVPLQFPNERTRVDFLIHTIMCNYTPLQASMNLIRNYHKYTGKMNSFKI